MIDIVKDYAAISAGTAQATASRAIGVGRAGAEQVVRLAQVDVGASAAALDPRSLVSLGRTWATGLVRSDADDLAGRLGLVKKSELIAVRQQLHRLERRLGEVRGER